MKIGLTVILAAVALALTGCSLYDSIFDIKDGGGGMTNPDASVDGKELVEFSWLQNNSGSGKNFSLQFYVEDEQPSIRGFIEDRDSSERIENDKDESLNAVPWTINWVQWFDLQRVLAETKLPEYKLQSAETADDATNETTNEATDETIDETADAATAEATDETTVDADGATAESNENTDVTADESDSRITIVWRENGTEQTVMLDGSNADTLEEYVLGLVKEAHDAYASEK